MAFFDVTKETIDRVWDHPNADRLSLATLRGMSFQFVVGKDADYHPGDEVFYFPVDSVLPDNIQDILGLKGRLAGANKNRVKTIKLRGEISQGVVCSVSKLTDNIPGIIDVIVNNGSIAEFLGVEKYEPPEQLTKLGKLVQLPPYLSKYDIEGADRYQSALNELMDQYVFITEKLEGSNFSVSLDNDGLHVNQRNFQILEIEGHTHSFWDVVRRENMGYWLEQLKIELEADTVALYGEFIGPGVQGNLYRLKQHEVRFFDIKADEEWLNYNDFKYWCNKLNIPTVPEVFRGSMIDFLGGRTIQEASNGVSLLCDTKREGIVIRPAVEQYSTVLKGRLLLKQRSPDYLVKSDF